MGRNTQPISFELSVLTINQNSANRSANVKSFIATKRPSLESTLFGMLFLVGFLHGDRTPRIHVHRNVHVGRVRETRTRNAHETVVNRGMGRAE